MSLLARRIAVGAHKRCYSSYFSNKPGGRYFNTPKPPNKSVVAAGKDGDGGSGAKSSSGSTASAPGNVKAKADEAVGAGQPGPPSPDAAPPPSSAIASSSPAHTSSASSHPIFTLHPTIQPQDFKLHQFFALHRPLLTVSQPASQIFSPPPLAHPLFASSDRPASSAPPPPAHLGTLDDPPEASADADADAARQLARALVMSRAGGAVQWEDTLKHLGVDDEGRRIDAAECAREWEGIYADSTRRKKRKKMKKHKLKKRRKLQRAQRLKLGK